MSVRGAPVVGFQAKLQSSKASRTDGAAPAKTRGERNRYDKRRHTHRQSIVPLETRTEFDSLIEELFKLTDVGGAGSILFGDFLAHHEKLIDSAVSLPSYDYEEAETNFKNLDRDHNGRLDRQEFGDYMEGILAVLGNRNFRNTCNDLIQKEQERRRARRSGFDIRFSSRLVDQARNANYFLPELQAAAITSLSQKADPNFLDETGSHVLIYAAGKAEAGFVARLLEFRAVPSLHNKVTDCAAFVAARARNLDILSLLLLPDASETLEDTEHQESQRLSQNLVRNMSQLTESGLQNLLAKRADVNYKDQSGWTPLTAAVFFGKSELLDALLKTQRAVGKNKLLRLDGWNSKGRGPLHIAARKGHASLVLPLVRARGDADAQDIDGWTPLHHAAFNGRSEVIQVLLNSRADVFLQGHNGLTAWQVTKLAACAGSLMESVLKSLKPPEEVDFAKTLLPVLKDGRLTTFDRLHGLLSLPGVHHHLGNLRLHDQFFDTRHGPNKARLRKVWELLAMPMIRRLRSGETDLPLPEPHLSEEAKNNRRLEIEMRYKEQEQFVHDWMLATKGLRPSEEWRYENRLDYGRELQEVLTSEMEGSEEELKRLYEGTKALDGGDELIALPEQEVLRASCQSQLAAHPIPLWAEQLNTASAFEALRLVGASGMGKDNDGSLLAFMDLVTLEQDFNTGPNFWQNIYRLWLSEYAKVVDAEFHKNVKGIVDRFNTLYQPLKMSASYKSAPVKTYERIKAKECELGVESSHEHYEGRTAASKILDIVRGSVTVSSPRAVLILLEDFFRPLESARGRLKLARVLNGFNEDARTFHGYRSVDLHLLFEGGLVAGKCGRAGASMQAALVCEVQINLDSYLEVKKRRHLIHKCLRGDFDWETEGTSEGEPRNGLKDDDDLPAVSQPL